MLFLCLNLGGGNINILDLILKSRDKPKGGERIPSSSFLFGRSAAGGNVNELTATQMAAVYSCARVFVETLAGLPLHLYKRGDSNLKEKAKDHVIYFLLHDEPNTGMTSFIFRETLMTHLLLRENACAQIICNRRSEVIGLYPLIPNKMTVMRSGDGEIFYKHNHKSEEVYLLKEDVLYIPGLSSGGLIGYSSITMAKNAIGMAMACEDYGASSFQNGAQPGGVLEHPDIIKDPERVRESWNVTLQGPRNANKAAAPEEGMKYQPIAIAPSGAQFLETREFQLNEIVGIFRIPSHMIGDLEKSSFSNIEQQSLEFVKYTLDPWIVRWEQSLERALLTKKEKESYFTKPGLDGFLRRDYESRMNGYAAGRQNGWMSANGIRELENLDRILTEEGGDLYLVNGNILPLDKAGSSHESERDGDKNTENEQK